MDWWGARALTRALFPVTRPLGGLLTTKYTPLRQHQSDSFTTSGACGTAGADASGQEGQAQRVSSSTCSSFHPAAVMPKLYTRRHSEPACVSARASWLHHRSPLLKPPCTSSCRSISTAGPHTYSAHTTATSATVSTPTTSSTAPPASAATRRTIAVALSGGVDSAVAAWRLQQQGHRLVGVFMRNWDEREETGNDNCSVEADLRGAQAVARHLGIDLVEADFVQDYWNKVFSHFTSEYARGLTPNPDLACNRYIKFDALVDFAHQQGCEQVATGHYARLVRDPGSGVVQLLRGLDPSKDQSYFLASVRQAMLERFTFPVGDMRKQDVRRLAAELDLPPADRRSSAGICFIGRRSFGDFMAQYVPRLPGQYVDVDSARPLGPCADVLAVTQGQRASIGGMPEKVYVVGKDVQKGVVYVGTGREHPALFCDEVLTRPVHWVAGSAPQELQSGGMLQCYYQARYRQTPGACSLAMLGGEEGGLLLPVQQEAQQVMAARCAARAEAGEEGGLQGQGHSSLARIAGAGGGKMQGRGSSSSVFRASAFSRLMPEDCSYGAGYALASLRQPARGIAPGQEFVVYQGDVCLGAAPVVLPGRTLAEQGL